MRYQDDPKKCTAARLLKAGIARRVRSAQGSRKIVLNPYCDAILMPFDRRAAGSIVGIDCSWRLAQREFADAAHKGTDGRGGRGNKPDAVANYIAHQKTARSLPPLLAGNSVNYAKVGMLTTAEAIAAALFIMGYEEQGHLILGRFKWGHTFFDLNCNLLVDYAKMTDQSDVARIAAD